MITVTMPIEEYEKLKNKKEEASFDDKMKEITGYLDQLVEDVENGEIAWAHLKDFHFFHTKVGAIVISKLKEKGVHVSARSK